MHSKTHMYIGGMMGLVDQRLAGPLRRGRDGLIVVRSLSLPRRFFFLLIRVVLVMLQGGRDMCVRVGP